MRNTFLELEDRPMHPCDFCYIGICYCSADYLLGVQKAADLIDMQMQMEAVYLLRFTDQMKDTF